MRTTNSGSSLTVHLRTAIESWAFDLRRSSPLLQLARQGRLPPHALALYLESLRYLFLHSQANLIRAATTAREHGNDDLASHFARKAAEEQGHDAWATADLARLPPSAARVSGPAHAIVALVDLQRRLIEQHLLCFATYALWAEYFTVLLGDEWLNALSASGFKRTHVSAIARHVDADRAHAANGFADLERLWRGEPAVETLVSAVEQAGRVFSQFCDEVYAAAPPVAGATDQPVSDPGPV